MGQSTGQLIGDPDQEERADHARSYLFSRSVGPTQFYRRWWCSQPFVDQNFDLDPAVLLPPLARRIVCHWTRRTKTEWRDHSPQRNRVRLGQIPDYRIRPLLTELPIHIRLAFR